jgi:hypothetical protein
VNTSGTSRVRFSLLLLLLLLLVPCSLTPTSSPAAISAEITAQPSSPRPKVLGASPVEGSDSLTPHVDVLGNEVEAALADYRVDRSGDIYERHSPETAVLRLGSPSS